MSQDVIRDLEQGAARLTAATPRVRVFVTPEGQHVATLVVAEGPTAATEAAAVRKLADLVAGMLDANIDHDRVFYERLKTHAAPEPAE